MRWPDFSRYGFQVFAMQRFLDEGEERRLHVVGDNLRIAFQKRLESVGFVYDEAAGQWMRNAEGFRMQDLMQQFPHAGILDVPREDVVVVVDSRQETLESLSEPEEETSDEHATAGTGTAEGRDLPAPGGDEPVGRGGVSDSGSRGATADEGGQAEPRGDLSGIAAGGAGDPSAVDAHGSEGAQAQEDGPDDGSAVAQPAPESEDHGPDAPAGGGGNDDRGADVGSGDRDGAGDAQASDELILESARFAAQHTMEAFLQARLEQNRYRAHLEEDPEAMERFREIEGVRWKQGIEAAAQAGLRASDAALDDYIAHYGEQAFHAVFRGIAEQEDYLPPSAREEGDSQPTTSDSGSPDPGAGDSTPRPENFRIHDLLDEAFSGTFDPNTRAMENVRAMEILFQYRDDPDANPPQEDKESLARYVGWGGMPKIMEVVESEAHPDQVRTVFRMRKVPDGVIEAGLRLRGMREEGSLSDREFRALRRSVLNAHYTDDRRDCPVALSPGQHREHGIREIPGPPGIL